MEPAAEATTVMGRRRRAVVVSVAAHVVVLAVLVRGHEQRPAARPAARLGMATLAVAEVRRPSVASADAAGGGGGGGAEAAPARSVRKADSVRARAVRPVREPSAPARGRVEAAEETETGEGETGAEDGETTSPGPGSGAGPGSGTGSGDGGGEGGGRGRATGYLAVSSAPAPVERPVAFSRARPARLIWPVRRGDESEGTLFVARVHVDREGIVVGARLAAGPPRARESDALTAVWRFRYAPALDDEGRPTASWVDQPFVVRR